MESFEEWLEGVPALALRELAGGGYSLRSLSIDQVRQQILEDEELRQRAEYSFRREREAQEWKTGFTPRQLADLRRRWGLVD